MAGICGFINFGEKFNNEYILSTVKNMNSALYNAKEEFIYVDENCAIGGTNNFAQLDSKIVFFLGDLYNKRELCSAYGMSECSEAQLIVQNINEQYKSFIQKMSGKFVFVIYDKNDKKLTVVRDKVGSKQMYYYKNDEVFIFSTELSGILSTGIVDKTVDKVALSTFLQLTYIPAPLSIIESVKKVKPATEFTIDKRREIQEEDYWQISYNTDENSDFESSKKELKELLYGSVKNKMELYKDSGVFLSGGFDSSIVVGIMSDLSDNPVKTFTIGYGEKEYDESELARLVALKNQTDHIVLKLDWDTVAKDVYTVLEGLDEPYADSSLIATYAVCNLAKEHIKVAFMGDAGDELFAGYNKYLISYYGDKYKKVPRFLRKAVIEPLVKLIPIRNFFLLSVSKVISSAELSVLEQRKRLMCLGFKAEELKELMLDGFVDEMNFIDEQYEFLKDADEQTKAQYIDFKTVLEGDMLPKVELAEKLSGIKTCAPILDDKIIDFSYSLPTKFKISKTNRKIILKEAFRNLLPEELFSAPKHGFAVPIGKWLETNLRERLLEFANEDFLKKQGLFDCKYINQIIKEHLSHKQNRYSELWAFFVFQNWYRKYIEE